MQKSYSETPLFCMILGLSLLFHQTHSIRHKLTILKELKRVHTGSTELAKKQAYIQLILNFLPINL